MRANIRKSGSLPKVSVCSYLCREDHTAGVGEEDESE